MTTIERSETPLVDDFAAGDLLVSTVSGDVVATVVDPNDENGWLVLADNHREWRPSRPAIERALAGGRWRTNDPASEITLEVPGTFDVPRDDPVLDAAPIVVDRALTTDRLRLRVADHPRTEFSMRTTSAIERGAMRYDRDEVASLGFGEVQVGTVTTDGDGRATIQWFDEPRER